MGHGGSSRLKPLISLLLLGLCVTLALVTGCDVLPALLGGMALTASDGNHATYIEVSWNAPSLQEGVTVSGYTLYRTPDNGSFNPFLSEWDCSYDDADVVPAEIYTYYVVAMLSDGTFIESNTDTGFALDAKKLTFTTFISPQTIALAAGKVHWFWITVQKSWTYHFTCRSGGSTISLPAGIYPDDDPQTCSFSDASGNWLWKCPESGDNILRLDATAVGSAVDFTWWFE